MERLLFDAMVYLGRHRGLRPEPETQRDLRLTPSMTDNASPRRFATWQVVAGFLVLGTGAHAVSVVAAVVAMAVEMMRARTEGVSLPPADALPWWGMTVAVVCSAVVLVGGSAAAAGLAGVSLRSALGWRWPPASVVLLAMVAAVAASPVAGLMVALAEAVAPGFTLGTMDAMNRQVAAVPMWLAVPTFALLPAVSEETFFRGFLQRSIRRPWMAISLSAVLFAAYHVDPHHAAGTLPLGMLLAWVAWRTDSVVVSMAGHAAFNLFAVVVQRVAGHDGQEGGFTATSAGLAAAGAFIAVTCMWGIARIMRSRRRPLASVAGDA